MTLDYEQIPAHDGSTLPKETSVYRYLSAMAFMDLLATKSLGFSKISSWDDAQEGTRFDAMKLRPDHPYSDKDLGDFYASCWTLQTEDRSIFGSDGDAYQRSVNELKKFGSDAMWRAYCSGGGVRIETSLAKLEALFCDADLRIKKLYSGRVYYDSDESNWSMTPKHHPVSAFLQKRVCFRSEAEFRFLFCFENRTDVAPIKVPIRILSSLIDEILVSPAKPTSPWNSQVLLKVAKGNAPECRISQLYGRISEGN